MSPEEVAELVYSRLPKVQWTDEQIVGLRALLNPEAGPLTKPTPALMAA